MKIKDYSVSGEIFFLIENKKFGFLETHPRPSDIATYYESENYISHTDGNKGIFEKIYQLVKKITLQQKITLIKKYISEGNLLDIGAGTGDFLAVAKKHHFKIFGIEPSKNARILSEKKGIFLEENTNNISEKFNCITMWHSLEHIPNLYQQISFLKNHLEKEGILVIALPNYKSKDAEIYKNFWAGYDVPRHLWHFSRNSFETLFSENGFKIIAIKPMFFDAFYVSLLSEKYKNGKMNFIRGFFSGLYSNFCALKTKEYSSLIYILKHQKCST